MNVPIFTVTTKDGQHITTFRDYGQFTDAEDEDTKDALKIAVGETVIYRGYMVTRIE
jgi:hypothetical protein